MEHGLTERRVAEAVAAAMQTAGVTQTALASDTGIPLSTLNRRLLGHQPFTIRELASIATALGVSITDITSAAEAVA